METANVTSKFFLICLNFVFIASAVHARTIYVDVATAGANNGSSWVDAYSCLQDAISEARSTEKPVEIRVAGGMYRPDMGKGQTHKDRKAKFQLIDAVTLKGGFAGAGGPNPEFRDVKLYETILSGDLAGNDAPVGAAHSLVEEPTRADNSHYVVASIKTHKTAIIDGFSITGGNKHGMYNRRGSPTITNCTFSGNQADRWGGGLCNESGNPILINCTFSSNWAQYGGGVWSQRGNPIFTQCVFTSNSATYGGGMYNYDNSQPQVINCTFTNNTANYGGAMYSNNNCQPEITNCTIAGNTAYGDGGAISNIDNCLPMLTNCILWGDWPNEIVDHFRSHSIVNYSYVCDGKGEPWFGEGCIDADPLFMGVDNLRLSPDSPCIDAGDNTALPSEITTALDGNPRFINGTVDIGAFESDGSL